MMPNIYGKYEEIKFLESGGFGKVFKCIDKDT